MEEYLNLHKQVDVILDSWPYSGGTTTAYAMQYGIPTITISGVTVAQNQSAGHYAKCWNKRHHNQK